MNPAQASRKARVFTADDGAPSCPSPDTPDLRVVFGDQPTDVEIRTALDALLADKNLHMSDRNRRFLRFVVEEKLEGRAERIKSYTVAVDVFGRAPTFDSLTDPIVRIEATRLRTALDNYYAGPGANAEIVFNLPKGGYVPLFRRRGAPSDSSATQLLTKPVRTLSSRHAVILTAAVSGTVLATALLLAAYSPWRESLQAQAPIIALEPVHATSGSAGESELARGLTQSILSGLSRFPGMRLVHMREGRASAGAGIVGSAGAVPVYLMQSNLRASENNLRFWWSITDGRTGETLWSENIDQPRTGHIEMTIEDEIASRVAARIAEPYGIIGAETPTAVGKTGPGYDCVLQARAQQALPDPDRNPRIRSCLEQTVAFAPEYGDAWALLALTYLYEEYFAERGGPVSLNLVTMANEAAERATKLAPHSGLAYQALLVSRFRQGDFPAANDAAERALELNPNDPEILHAAGVRAYIRGRTDEGLTQVRKSLELATRLRPGTQFVLALDAYRRGDFDRAHELVERAEGKGMPLLQVLCAASHAQLGEPEEARRDLEKLAAMRPNYGSEMRRDLVAFHFDEELAALLIDGARKAGLEVR